MKRSILVLLLAFIVIQNCASQETYEARDYLIIKAMPLSMIDYRPRLRFGLEYKANNRLGYSIDLGIGNMYLNRWRLDGLIWGQDYSFFEIRPELKYIFENTQDYYLYFALELFYMEMSDHLLSRYYEKENSNVKTTFESATLNKQKYGFHLKAGANIIAYKRLNIDIYGGFGFAKRNIAYTDVVNPVTGTEAIFLEWGPQPELFEGESTIFHIALGLKMGYTFWIQ